ncbi:MAG TPA: hypothetical protein VJ505_15715 [Holophagaceae bacterium]|nr:hypothetical protein [Holophagaceae bacterium]
MRFRRPANPRLLRMGFTFLILSMLIQGFALRSTWVQRLGSDTGDRLQGLFLGLSIGLMFMAFRVGAKGGPSSCSHERLP